MRWVREKRRSSYPHGFPNYFIYSVLNLVLRLGLYQTIPLYIDLDESDKNLSLQGG